MTGGRSGVGRTICMALVVALVAGSALGEVPVSVARGGLGNVFARLRQGRPTTILWFGGSITAGAGASNPEAASYRGLVGRWFVDTFPNAKVTNVNSAIGGTGSDLGAFRAPRDILPHRPDLVFVEYAVNDGGTPEAMMTRSMEGIVRQVRRALPFADVCFVYTFVVGQLAEFKQGQPIRTVRCHEQVAERYGLPSVNLAVPAAARLIDGSMTEAQFAGDGVHPTDAGYRIYADALIGYLEQARKASGPIRRHSLPRQPMVAGCLERARMITPQEIGSGNGWSVETKDPCGAFPAILVAGVPGSQLSVPFSGTILALFDVLGPDTGGVDYRIDEGEWKVLSPFDQWAKDYYRAHYTLVADGLPDGKHTLTMRVRAEKHADSKGTVVRIGYLLANDGAGAP